MDFRHVDFDAVIDVVAQLIDAARPVPVIAGQTGPGIVLPSMRVAAAVRVAPRFGVNPEPLRPRFVQHPLQGYISQPVIGIAAADIGVHAGKPDLRELLVAHRLHFAVDRPVFAPQHGTECRALVVERQCMTDAIDMRRQIAVGQRHRPNIAIDAYFHFVERNTIGVRRVPHADEGDVRKPLFDLVAQRQIFPVLDALVAAAELLLARRAPSRRNAL